MRKALITGITGQDGSYLSQLLLKRATRFTALSGERAHLIRDESTIYTKMPTTPTRGSSCTMAI